MFLYSVSVINWDFAWNQFLLELHSTPLPLKVTPRLQSVRLPIMSRVLFSLPLTGFCKEFSKDFILWFVKITASEAPIAKPSDWVDQVLLDLKWTFVMAGLKRFFIADLKISGIWSLKYSSLSAISIASSIRTLVYKLLRSKDTTGSSSTDLESSKAVLASFELVSMFATDNLLKKEDRNLLRFS